MSDNSINPCPNCLAILDGAGNCPNGCDLDIIDIIGNEAIEEIRAIQGMLTRARAAGVEAEVVWSFAEGRQAGTSCFAAIAYALREWDA